MKFPVLTVPDTIPIIHLQAQAPNCIVCHILQVLINILSLFIHVSELG